MDAVRTTILEALVAVKPDLANIKMTDTSTMSDLGLDSVRLVEVGVHLEHALGGDVSLDAWLDQERMRPSAAFSIGSLVTFINESRTH
ncbi:MAG: acyl carrier protein [Myxococcales bacterium]|nr:acyl carrier protein [Myxococcales bacterium]